MKLIEIKLNLPYDGVMDLMRTLSAACRFTQDKLFKTLDIDEAEHLETVLTSYQEALRVCHQALKSDEIHEVNEMLKKIQALPASNPERERLIRLVKLFKR